MKAGQRIKIIRKGKGLTQKELGELAKISYKQIGLYEQGKRNPKLETINKIALALGVRIEDITGFEKFDSGEEFEKRRKELLAKNKKTQELTVIHSSYEGKMQSLMKKLNNDGKDKAIEQVELLTLIERYTKK